MDAHTRKVYVPMTETGFYILLCLREPNHGYGIVQKVKELTDGEIVLAPGTMYGSLSKMEKDGIIQFVKEERWDGEYTRETIICNNRSWMGSPEAGISQN